MIILVGFLVFFFFMLWLMASIVKEEICDYYREVFGVDS